MTTIDISYPGLCIGLLLMLIPLFFFWRLHTGLVKSTLTGTVRMCVQLLLIGVYLRYLFAWNNAWVNLLWVVLMVGVAAQTATTRTRLRRSVLWWPVFVGFLLTALATGFYFLGLVVRLDNVFSSRYFIPIMGVLLGNMLSVNIIALDTYYGRLHREQQLYYYLVGNGATRFEATVPFLRAAVVKAFTPCIANLAVMGVVSLPGTMIGQILGGSEPGVAVRYQMMIVVVTIVSSMLSLMFTVFLSARSAFDDYGRLRPVFRTKKHK